MDEEFDIEVGQRLSFEGNLCTVRFIGEVDGTSGLWLGVEWDDQTRGKHDGRHRGKRYFSCDSLSRTAASFVRPTRPADPPQTFLSALHRKYGATGGDGPSRQIVISGKVAEEVGFDKIRRQQAQLGELKIVILDGTQLKFASKDGEETIGSVCPKVTDLDMSRNLFTRLEVAVEVCAQLKQVKTLRLNGNRFELDEDDELAGAEEAFSGIKELGLDETMMRWEQICQFAAKFPDLGTLVASNDRLHGITPIPPAAPFLSTLVSINLEYNEFTAITDLAPLSAISTLRSIHLKGSKISAILPTYTRASIPLFNNDLHYIDLSYNQVASWAFVDELITVFPGLNSLRFAHNPIYDNPHMDTTTTSDEPITATSIAAQGTTSGTGNTTAPSSDEAYMFLVARLPQLKSLNFSTISSRDRIDADMFYLGRIARQLAAVSEDREEAILARHPRWKELCEEYGAPAVKRHKEMDPNWLDARLIEADFYLAERHQAETGSEKGQQNTTGDRMTRIPKSYDIYAVKSIAGKMFSMPPLGLRLVWETGEWDPVAGFDDEVGDSSDDEDGASDMETEAEQMANGGTAQTQAQEESDGKRPGRWVKREVELKDGPRQFGYCVDGLQARIRVERL